MLHCISFHFTEQKIEIEEMQHRQEMGKSKIQHQLAMKLREEEERRRKWETDKERALQVCGQIQCRCNKHHQY